MDPTPDPSPGAHRARRVGTPAQPDVVPDLRPVGRLRLDSLTGLRWFAAFAVFTRHANGSDPGHFFGQGAAGVSFFFILSGFVLAWSRRDEPARFFYQRRIARIYPAFLVALALAAWIRPDTVTIGRLISGTTMTQAWSSDPATYYAINGVAWSLACEAFFYLLFPFVFVVLARLSTGGQRLTALLVAAAAIAIPLIVHAPGSSGTGFWFIYIFPPVRMLEFTLGILLALELRRGTRIPIGLSTAVLIAAAAYVAAGYVPLYAMWVAVTIIPFALLIAAAATSDLNGSGSLFRLRPLVILGEWSFAFYLVHARLLNWVQHQVHRNDLRFEEILVGLLLSLVVAAGLHYVIERPFERLLRPSPRASAAEGTAARVE